MFSFKKENKKNFSFLIFLYKIKVKHYYFFILQYNRKKKEKNLKFYASWTRNIDIKLSHQLWSEHKNQLKCKIKTEQWKIIIKNLCDILSRANGKIPTKKNPNKGNCYSFFSLVIFFGRESFVLYKYSGTNADINVRPTPRNFFVICYY